LKILSAAAGHHYKKYFLKKISGRDISWKRLYRKELGKE
jgi:hypothetical protein